MFATLLAAAAAAPAAPVPADTNPAPAGPAPWVVHLKADDAGQLRLLVQTQVTVKQTRSTIQIVNGQRVVQQQQVDVPTMQSKQVTVADLSGTVAAADGSPVGVPELLRQARGGVTVLISADGKAVDRAWLRAVAPATIVVVAADLAGAASPPQPIGVRAVVYAAPPRLTLLTAGPDGTVRVSTSPGANIRYLNSGRMIIMNGNPLMLDDGIYPGPGTPGAPQLRPLSEVGFDAYDLTGRLVERDAAVRRLRAGGLVLLAAGRFPDDAHLRPFRGDVLVLVSNENLAAPGGSPAAPQPVAPQPELAKPVILRAAPVLRVVPAPAPVPVP